MIYMTAVRASSLWVDICFCLLLSKPYHELLSSDAEGAVSSQAEEEDEGEKDSESEAEQETDEGNAAPTAAPLEDGTGSTKELDSMTHSAGAPVITARCACACALPVSQTCVGVLQGATLLR